MSDDAAARAVLRTRAPAKVNLTLHVLERWPDGYHELESLVVFAGVADHLALAPGGPLSLIVDGPKAGATGPYDDNLVLKAARLLAGRRPGLTVGAFRLTKRLPAAAGIGGGSSDAAAALRLLARANSMSLDDSDVVAVARATGADVPVCLDPQARMIRGAGEVVGEPLVLPRLFAVLVNPSVAVPTPNVFRRLALAPGEKLPGAPHPDVAARPGDLLEVVAAARNDLEPPAVALAPEIGQVLERMRASPGCRLARMSGSGATVFAIFGDCHEAARAAAAIRSAKPDWWVKPTMLR